MIGYADTGFLVSLYGQDQNSPVAKAISRSRPVFILTPLGEAEFVNALELRVFRKDWTRQEARLVQEMFLQQQAAGVFRMESMVSMIWETGVALSRRYSARIGCRTLDVLHVATALVIKPDVFYSFDERQRKVAKAEQLNVLPA